MAVDIGDAPRFKATFRDFDDVLTDPTTVVARIQDPSGNVTAYTYGVDPGLVRVSVGVFYVTVTIDESGVWRHRWNGTGALVAVEEDHLLVQTQLVPDS